MFDRQPVQLFENWSDMSPGFGVCDETGSSILNTLQRIDSRLWKASECGIAVVEVAQNQCCDQSLGDLLTGGTAYLAQSSQLEEAAAHNPTDMLPHRKLGIEVDIKVTYKRDWHDDVIANCEGEISRRNLT